MKFYRKYYLPLIVFCIIYLSLFAVLGFDNWPKPGDDFHFANNIAEHGFWGAQYFMYTQWTGRILNTFLLSLCVLAPLEKICAYLPLISIILYILAVYMLVSVVIPKLQLKIKFLLSMLITAMTFAFIQSLDDMFYWMAGMPFFWSSILFLIEFALAVKALNGSNLSFLGCCIVIYLNGTLLEMPAIFQGVIAFLAMIIFAFRRDKKRMLMTCIFWLISIAAFATMYFAPGTAVRMYHDNPGLTTLTSRIIRAFVIAASHGMFTGVKFFVKPLIYVFLLFVPMIQEKLNIKFVHLKAWQIIIITFIIAPLMQTLTGFSTGRGLPERAISLTLWFMGFVWALLWIFCYKFEAERLHNFNEKLRWAILFLSILISFNTRDVISDLKISKLYRLENQEMANQILKQKSEDIQDVIVQDLEHKTKFMSLNMISPRLDEKMATYYSVNSILVFPKSLMDDEKAIKDFQDGNVLYPVSKLAELGDVDSVFLLAYWTDPMYGFENYGMTRNKDEAEKYYRIGVEKKDIRCMRALSRIIYKYDHSILRAMYWLAMSQFSTLRL